MYEKIQHPKTGKWHNINSSLGNKLVKGYAKKINQTGRGRHGTGAGDDAASDVAADGDAAFWTRDEAAMERGRAAAAAFAASPLAKKLELQEKAKAKRIAASSAWFAKDLARHGLGPVLAGAKKQTSVVETAKEAAKRAKKEADRQRRAAMTAGERKYEDKMRQAHAAQQEAFERYKLKHEKGAPLFGW